PVQVQGLQDHLAGDFSGHVVGAVPVQSPQGLGLLQVFFAHAVEHIDLHPFVCGRGSYVSPSGQGYQSVGRGANRDDSAVSVRLGLLSLVARKTGIGNIRWRIWTCLIWAGSATS